MATPTQPTHTAASDTRYLAEALARAGRPPSFAEPAQEQFLDGGRTGTRVTRLTCANGCSFVLKVIPRERAFREALCHDGEAAAWLAGATRVLPPPLVNPTLDATLHPERDEWWLLMDDVSPDIVTRSGWTEAHTLRLFEAMASLHATHWEAPDTPREGIGTLSATTALLVEIALYASTGRASVEWAARSAEAFQVPRMLLPGFLEAAGTGNADFYLTLLRRWRDIVAALDDQPSTLLHGDLRRANVAFVDGQVVLFDWELAARGSAAADLAWHWFLHYWAYPPNDGRLPTDRLWLRDAYLDRLEEQRGSRVDRDAFRVSWELAWLRVFCQLGFVLADGLAEDHSNVRRQRIQDAFQEARRIVDEHLP
ncbi:phosphotransferase [Aquisalimonas sp.]|uniref:phosphotransferase family protein n=1 Tax=Aquisalimonas sp. TaxID=1872621 RepID=UPI0025BB69CC|nr:phosphotransferase [Aquisalimonas sp.]